MAEASLDSVIDKLESVNMDYRGLSESLDKASGEMESNTTNEALRQVSELISKQGDMDAKERRASRKEMANIAKLIGDSKEVGDSDKQRFQSLIQMHDQRVKSDSSLMNDVGAKITDTLTEGVTNISAVVAGVVSDSPILALGVKFLGDSVRKGVVAFRNFRKKKRQEKEIREKQRELFREQERIDSEERRVLREQISESDVQNKLNLSEEDIQKKAEEANKTREQIYNEERDRIIEQSKIAKEQRENAQAEQKRIQELRDSVGLDLQPTDQERVSPITEIEGDSAEVNQITNQTTPDITQISGESTDTTRISSTREGADNNVSNVSDTSRETIAGTPGEQNNTIDTSQVSTIREGADNISNVSDISRETVAGVPAEQSITRETIESSSEVPQITPVRTEESSGGSEVPVSSPFLQEIRDLLEYLGSQQSEGELSAIETQREKKRSDQANLRVERKQSSLLENSIESAEESREESRGAFESIAGGIGMFKGVLRFLMGIPRVLAMLFSPVALKIMAVGAGIAAAVAFISSDLPQKIGEFIAAIPEKISDAISGFFDSFVSFIRGILSKIPIIGKFFKDDEESNENSTPTPSASNRRGRGASRTSPVANPNITNANQETNIDQSVTNLPAASLGEGVEENANVVVLDERRRSRRGGRGSRRGMLGLDSPNVVSAETEGISVIPTELAQGTQSSSQSVGVGGGAIIPAGESTPMQQVSGTPTQELGNVSSPTAGMKTAAAMTMKENAIEKRAATNISPILNNLSNVTNNNVSNSSSTVIPTKAYNTENSFNKINSALSGAV
tara:strand:- start:1020 stop:3416 length:2397 start_codon:yes stop_codon:yes gene_type:complete